MGTRPDDQDHRRAGPSERLLVVTADDYGLTTATSRAILEAHERGLVTAVSVLPNAPATATTLSWLADHDTLEVGAHLALVGEDPPVSPAASIPTLVDRHGRLPASWRHLVPAMAARRIDPDDLRREVTAQLEVVAGAGRPVTHLNAHQHLHLWPLVRPLVLAAALERGIGFVRTPGSEGRGPTSIVVRRLARTLRADLGAAGLATTAAFVGLDQAGHLDGPTLQAALGRVQGTSVEVNLHPGAPTDPDRHRYRWGYRWGAELAGALDPRSRAEAADAGFRLVGPSAVPRPDPTHRPGPSGR